MICITSFAAAVPVGPDTNVIPPSGISDAAGYDYFDGIQVNADRHFWRRPGGYVDSAGVRHPNAWIQLADTWLDPAADPADYECMAAVTSGSTPSGSPLNAWINCSASPQWTISASAYGKNTSLAIRFRHVGTSTILATTNVALSAAGDGTGRGDLR